MRQTDDKEKKSLNALKLYFTIPVVLCHCYFLENARNFWGDIYANVFSNGGFSVTFFILLSGFFIARGYTERFEILTAVSCREFIKKRFWKLYPLYFITMLYAFFYEVCTGVELWGGFESYFLH